MFFGNFHTVWNMLFESRELPHFPTFHAERAILRPPPRPRGGFRLPTRWDLALFNDSRAAILATDAPLRQRGTMLLLLGSARPGR